MEHTTACPPSRPSTPTPAASYVCVRPLDGELVEPGVVVDHAVAALAGDQLAAEHPPGQVEMHDALHGAGPVAEGHQPCRTGRGSVLLHMDGKKRTLRGSNKEQNLSSGHQNKFSKGRFSFLCGTADLLHPKPNKEEPAGISVKL